MFSVIPRARLSSGCFVFYVWADYIKVTDKGSWAPLRTQGLEREDVHYSCQSLSGICIIEPGAIRMSRTGRLCWTARDTEVMRRLRETVRLIVCACHSLRWRCTVCCLCLQYNREEWKEERKLIILEGALCSLREGIIMRKETVVTDCFEMSSFSQLNKQTGLNTVFLCLPPFQLQTVSWETLFSSGNCLFIQPWKFFSL